MNLLVVSHKECWADPSSPSGYATVGGFPLQMAAISQLFDETSVIATLRETERPPGTSPICGRRLTVDPLPAPSGQDLRRKVALVTWLPRHLATLWRAVKEADAVHAPVPGDVGLIGILVALAQGKPLFVRHCGIWDQPLTAADHFLFWLLQRIAGGRNVVMATGGGERSPSEKNPRIGWIHSTTLTEAEIVAITPATPWQRGDPLRLITVGRMSASKNVAAAIKAMPLIRQRYTRTCLTIVGDGPSLAELRQLAHDAGMQDSVTFCGNVSHDKVLDALQQSHIFVFPTRREGFPKAVLEALACGLPVIATPVSVLPDLIGDEHGTIISDPTPKAIANAVSCLISDDERLAKMSSSAQQVARKYSLEKWQQIIGERLEAAWNESLSGGHD